jgi:hypothetical protein
MRAIEGEGPQTTLMELITGDGVQVLSPDELNDEQLSVKLWEVIHAIHNSRRFKAKSPRAFARGLFVN